MARRACAFRITDVTRLNRAVKAGGCVMVRVEFGIDGRIVAVTAGENGQDDLDRKLTEFKAHACLTRDGELTDMRAIREIA